MTPIYHLALWSADLRRCVACEIEAAHGAALLDRFEAAGRSALKLALIEAPRSALRRVR